MQGSSALGVAAAVGLALGIGAALWPRIEDGLGPRAPEAPPIGAPRAVAAGATAPAAAAARPTADPRLTTFDIGPPAGAASAGVSVAGGPGTRVRVERFTQVSAGAPRASCEDQRAATLSDGTTLSACGDGRMLALLVQAPWGDVARVEQEVVAKTTVSSPYAKGHTCGAGTNFLTLPRHAHWWAHGSDSATGVGSCAGAAAGAARDVAAELVRLALPPGATVEVGAFQNTRAGASVFSAYAAGADADAVWLALAGGVDELGAGFVVLRWPREQPPADVPFGPDVDAKVTWVAAHCASLPCGAAIGARGIVYPGHPDLGRLIDRCIYACRGEPAPPAALAPMDQHALDAVLEDATRWPPDWRDNVTPERTARDAPQ